MCITNRIGNSTAIHLRYNTVTDLTGGFDPSPCPMTLDERLPHGTVWTAQESNMPRFAANLAYLFTERPFMERFGAAAAAGFKAVELQFPYDQSPAAVRAALDRHGLTVLGINTPQRNGPGAEAGLAAVPGRETEFAALFQRALDYVIAIGGRQIHVMAGCVPPEQRPAA